jgi:hypothetical protein
MGNNQWSPLPVTLLKGSSLPFLWQPTWSVQETNYMSLNQTTQTSTFAHTNERGRETNS